MQGEATGTNGLNPLHMAASNGSLKAARVLASEFSASVNATDNGGLTSLHHAAINGSADVVQMLLDHGADVDVLSLCGRTPLQCARDAHEGHQAYEIGLCPAAT